MCKLEATHPIVPERNVVMTPFDAGMEIHIMGDLLEQELENSIGFSLGNANDAAGETCNMCIVSEHIL